LVSGTLYYRLLLCAANPTTTTTTDTTTNTTNTNTNTTNTNTNTNATNNTAEPSYVCSQNRQVVMMRQSMCALS